MDDFSGVDGLRLGTAPDPSPGSGEAVLEVKFAALNPADRYLAERQYPAKPALPHILGRDGLGVIAELGAGVTGIRPGDRRVVLRGETGINRPGTFAERVAVPVQSLVELPADWSEEEASGATLVYLTAYQALTMWSVLPPNTVVLVTGASGGVGVASVQLAVAMGHTVVGLSRSAEKGQRVTALGAAAVFNPADADWRKKLRAYLGQRRVDIAIDNIGGKLLPEIVETLGDLGKVRVVGRLAGPVPDFNTAALLFRRIRLGGVTVGAYSNTEARSAWQQVLELLSRTKARPLVDSIFPFEQLPKAFQRLADGPMGKVLLQVRR